MGIFRAIKAEIFLMSSFLFDENISKISVINNATVRAVAHVQYCYLNRAQYSGI